MSTPPTLKDVIFTDLDRELTVTRPILQRVPDEHLDWKPHEKSMSLKRLASHVAQLPDWIRSTLVDSEVDFAKMPPLPKLETSAQILAFFDKNVLAVQKAVAEFDVSKINDPWTIRQGPQIFATRPKLTVYRIWSLNHLINHRAQLNLYLRLLNVPIPAIYFNSADEPEMKFD